MKPDPTLTKKRAKKKKAVLLALQAKLSAKELQAIVEQEKKLAGLSEEIEHQSIDCLPKVTLHDVSNRAKDFSLDSSPFDPLTLYFHPCFTNRIIYTDLCFDLPAIDFQNLPLLSTHDKIVG